MQFDKGPQLDRHTVQLKTKNNGKKVQLDIRETLLMPGAFEQSRSKTLGKTEVKVKSEELRGPTCSFVSVLWPVYTAKSPGVVFFLFFVKSTDVSFRV